jgi:hypothetical protein
MVLHLGEASVFCLDDDEPNWYQVTVVVTVKPMDFLSLAE